MPFEELNTIQVCGSSSRAYHGPYGGGFSRSAFLEPASTASCGSSWFNWWISLPCNFQIGGLATSNLEGEGDGCSGFFFFFFFVDRSCCWGGSVYVEERTVDVHIRRLRKTLEPHGVENMVQTVRGSGYRFSAAM